MRGNRPEVVAKLDPLDSVHEPIGNTSASPSHSVRYSPSGAWEVNVPTTARLPSSGRPQRPLAERATQATDATTIRVAATIENTCRKPKSLPATSRSNAARPAPMANDNPITGSISVTSGGGSTGPMRASPIQASTQPTRAIAHPCVASRNRHSRPTRMANAPARCSPTSTSPKLLGPESSHTRSRSATGPPAVLTGPTISLQDGSGKSSPIAQGRCSTKAIAEAPIAVGTARSHRARSERSSVPTAAINSATITISNGASGRTVVTAAVTSPSATVARRPFSVGNSEPAKGMAPAERPSRPTIHGRPAHRPNAPQRPSAMAL